MSPANRTLNRAKVNFIIDIIMLMIMMLTAGVGLLIKYVLLPGFKRNLTYGRDVELSHWGLDRHQWGTVHLIISLVLLFLILLHIILHWPQIKRLFCIFIRDRQNRIIWAAILPILCLILAIGPLFIKPQMTLHRQTTGRDQAAMEEPHFREESEPQRTNITAKTTQHEHSSLSEEIPIHGYMTLNEVAAAYNVSALELAKHLDVPVGQTGKKLGQLRRQYNFQMSAVRAYIEHKLKPVE